MRRAIVPGEGMMHGEQRFPIQSSQAMVEIEPLQVEIELEEDGRFLASVPDLPGVMAYGDTQESAIRKAKAIALQVLADMVESGEELPQPLQVLFAA
jgi:predicted RNase H-like HicB family nuclease